MSGQTEYITKGSSQFSVTMHLLQNNSGSAPGEAITGLVYNSTNLQCYYKSGGTGTVTQLTLATQTSSGSFSLGGFAQLSSANMPGDYRLDLSTTLFSSGDDYGTINVNGYVNLASHVVHVKFTDLDLYSSMQSELATYGPSTHTSTDITDALNTYGASTHTTTDITDVLTSYGVSTLSSTSTILLSSSATSAQLVDDIMDESITGANHNVTNSLARFIREAAESAVLASGTATSATATTITLSSGGVSTDNIFDGERVAIIEGTGAGQSRLIQSSSGASDTLTVESSWVVNPDATSVYVIQGAEASIRAVAGQSVSATATVNFDNLSTLTSTDLSDSLSTYGVSTHTSTAITDKLTTYGVSTMTSTDINDQVLDVLNTDTFSLPGQGAPTNTPTLAEALTYLYKSWRNKKDNDGSTTQLYADDGSTVDQKQTTSVSSGVVTKAEWITGL